MCGEDGAQGEVYKLKEEPEKGIGREKERKERRKGERERGEKKEKRRVITGNLERSQEGLLERVDQS